VPRLSVKNYKYLVLRTNDKDGKSYEGFQWNTKIGGITKCSDWDPKPECGNGLHGLLNGCGGYLNNPHGSETQWMVCGINEYVDLENKVKFPEAVTLYVGDRKGASEYLDTHGCQGLPVYYALRTAGDGGMLIAGNRSTLTAGDDSTLTAGDGSTLTAGYGSTLTAGDDSTLKAGIYSILSVRYWDGNRYKLATVYVGEDGIQPYAPYRFNRDTEKFEEVK
jgi:hypothetical protein